MLQTSNIWWWFPGVFSSADIWFALRFTVRNHRDGLGISVSTICIVAEVGDCWACLALEHARLARHRTCYGQLVALSTCGDATWLPSKPSSHWAGNAFACLASLSNPSVPRSSTCDNRNTMKTLITRWLMEWEAGYCLEAEAVCPCVCPVYAIYDLPIVLVLRHWNTSYCRVCVCRLYPWLE